MQSKPKGPTEWMDLEFEFHSVHQEIASHKHTTRNDGLSEGIKIERRRLRLLTATTNLEKKPVPVHTREVAVELTKCTKLWNR